VDSSVAAGLLHEQGHEVIGVTLQLYDHGARQDGKVRAARVRISMMRAASRPVGHRALRDRRRGTLARAVIADFANSYASGETPVPCIRCKPDVKFSDLTRWLLVWERNGWRPDITCAGRWPDGPSCIGLPTSPVIRAGSCSRRRGRNWIGVGSHLAPCRQRAVRDEAMRLA